MHTKCCFRKTKCFLLNMWHMSSHRFPVNSNYHILEWKCYRQSSFNTYYNADKLNCIQESCSNTKNDFLTGSNLVRHCWWSQTENPIQKCAPRQKRWWLRYCWWRPHQSERQESWTFFRYTKMFSIGVLSDIQISLKIYFHKEPQTISATVSQAEQI